MLHPILYGLCAGGIVYLLVRVFGLFRHIWLMAEARRGNGSHKALPCGFPGRELFDA